MSDALLGREISRVLREDARMRGHEGVDVLCDSFRSFIGEGQQTFDVIESGRFWPDA